MANLKATINVTETKVFNDLLEVVKFLLSNVDEDIRQQANEILLRLKK